MGTVSEQMLPEAHLNVPLIASCPQPPMQSRSSKKNKEAKQRQQHRQYMRRIAEVLEAAKASMLECPNVANVDISDSATEFSVIVRPTALNDSSVTMKDSLVAEAKEALLKAASTNKCIYVMGYCNSDPFVVTSQGFQATFGAMENAKRVCWHIFKKGFCGHGANCSKQHAACEVLVRVIIETTALNYCAVP